MYGWIDGVGARYTSGEYDSRHALGSEETMGMRTGVGFNCCHLHHGDVDFYYVPKPLRYVIAVVATTRNGY